MDSKSSRSASLSNYRSTPSLESNLTHQSKIISRKQNQSLVQLSDQISQFILKLRENNVRLLQKLDLALSQKMILNQQIKNLQTLQIRRVQQQKKRRQKVMLQHLKNKQKLLLLLKEETDTYELIHQRKFTEKDLQKAQNYVTLRHNNFQLESQIRYQQGLANQEQSVNYPKQIQTLTNKKQELLQKYAVLSKPVPKINPKMLSLSKILEMAQHFPEKTKLQIQQLVNSTHSSFESTHDLQQYINDEQQQKTELYEQLKKMKLTMAQMEKQNKLMQEQLQLK